MAAPPLSTTARIALQKQLTQFLVALDSDNPVLIKHALTMLAQQLPAPALRAIMDSVQGYDFRAANAHTRQLAIDYVIDLGS